MHSAAARQFSENRPTFATSRSSCDDDTRARLSAPVRLELGLAAIRSPLVAVSRALRWRTAEIETNFRSLDLTGARGLSIAISFAADGRLVMSAGLRARRPRRRRRRRRYPGLRGRARLRRHSSSTAAR